MNEKLMRLIGQRRDLYPAQLERTFPNILEQLTEFWGTTAFDMLAEKLLLSSRNGRSGFPPEVVVELFHLANLHKDQMKLLSQEKRDIWGNLPEDGHRGTMDWNDG
ncbi:MAG: hypothetical protein PHU46_06985 [Rhodocyclaceae bacterium]|nr:hypothetical protein [Rhodocyclaceae bacterium]